MEMRLVRTDSSNGDFVELVRRLDADLAVRDGSEHAYYSQFNKIDMLRHVVVAELEGRTVGCGAIKEFEPGVMEVKRMYTDPAARGKGVATAVLEDLEKWAAELGYSGCILETGLRQPEAIALYRKCGYEQIPNYGQYVGMENSVCFRKMLSKV
jgi:putative acetyltransferase